MTIEVLPIRDIFTDDKYAWELLEADICVQMSKELSGSQIADLLALYMKGVEKMNSIQDPREEYFQQRVSSLMMQPIVMRALNEPQQTPDSLPSIIITPVSGDLLKKKQQMEMYLQYDSLQHSQNMNKIVMQHSMRVSSVGQLISDVIVSSNQKIEERIRKRKVKALTSRDKSISLQEREDQKVADTSTSPLEQQPKTTRKPRKVSTSLDEFETESPKRRRTFDIREDLQ